MINTRRWSRYDVILTTVMVVGTTILPRKIGKKKKLWNTTGVVPTTITVVSITHNF
ncbi:MAG: hypothetical protein GY821_15040 [Gammaproteobacteria bacterium]|nr:hypothetical protein [Gammaproteobacteria bacterium]